MNYPINDPYFRVEILSKTERPNLLCYLAMHQDYSESNVADKLETLSALTEQELGERLIRNCIKYNHWGVCYDEKTEVLTQTGFKFWKDVTESDLLYAVEPRTGVGHFEKPMSLVKYTYEGDMIKINHKRVNLLVTPDHRLYVKTRVNKHGVYGDLHSKTAQEMYGRQFKMSCETYLDNIDRKEASFSSNQLAIIGFWIGDGVICRNKIKKKIRFHVSVPRKTAYLLSLGCKAKGSDIYEYDDNNLADFLNNNCIDDSGNKILPEEFLFLPYEQFLSLSDGLAQSDGTHRSSRLVYDYGTSHKKLAEQLYLLYSLNGLSVKWTVEKHSEKNKNWRDNYRLIIHPNSEFRIEKNQQEKIKYKGIVYCAKVSTGALFIRRKGLSVISGNCEHPSITFNVIGFPHSVMVQARTHRVGISFDCQSQRYTGMRINKLANTFYDNCKDQRTEPYMVEKSLVEKVFYFRPIGEYYDREGNKYAYTESEREFDFNSCARLVMDYDDKIKSGFAPEHARDFLPQNIRQDFVVTFNARSLLHFCDLRLPKDAQPEIRTMAQMVFKKFEQWMPEVAEWYKQNRYEKNKLAP